ncbi:MAG TPA: hypothetical protein DEO73_08545 [Pantoea sp.]|nr:hypothetical protein [Pantoea sp.]
MICCVYLMSFFLVGIIRKNNLSCYGLSIYSNVVRLIIYIVVNEMENAILIPTYSEHFHHNVNFLESINEFCDEDGIPNVFFVTSTAEEANNLTTLIEGLSSKVKENTFIFDVEENFNNYKECIEKNRLDMDSPCYFFNGRSGIVNLKKLAGLEQVFLKGFMNVVVLDSEVLVFKKSNLLRCIEKNIEDDIYRYSFAAHNHELMTKIQYDSIRSVVWSFDNRSDFSHSYGWYENLCIYNKDKFFSFLNFFSDRCLDGYNIVVSLAYQLKSSAFEWISYMAYRLYVLEEKFDFVCVDTCVMSNYKGPIIMNPQNENLYQYMTGNEKIDSDFLSSFNPPWVPYTENINTRKILEDYLPDSCCLMFHVDRQHPGVNNPQPEVIIEKESNIPTEEPSKESIENAQGLVKVNMIKNFKELIKRIIN